MIVKDHITEQQVVRMKLTLLVILVLVLSSYTGESCFKGFSHTWFRSAELDGGPDGDLGPDRRTGLGLHTLRSRR